MSQCEKKMNKFSSLLRVFSCYRKIQHPRREGVQVLGRLRQEDCQLKASRGCRLNAHPGQLSERDSVSEREREQRGWGQLRVAC